MIHPEGFIDLRASAGAGVNEDSVWPSFTDIMTVIVMIFLMALVVILIRNVELVRQLRQTIALEQQALVQSDTAELRIATLGDEIAALQLRLGEANVQRTQAEGKATERQLAIGQLLGNIASLESVRDQLASEKVEFIEVYEGLESEILSMEERQQALEALRSELEIEVIALADEKTGLTRENITLHEELTNVTAERGRLVESVDAISAERERYRVESLSLTEKSLSLEEKLAELTSLKMLLERRIESLGKEKTALQTESTGLAEKNAGLNRKLSTLTLLQVQLETQVDELSGALTRLEQEKTRLVEENHSTTAWLATLLALKQTLENDQAALKGRLTGLEAERNVLVADQAKLESEVSLLMEYQLTLEQEKAGLVDKTRLLEVEMAKEGDTLRAEIATLLSARATLRKEQAALAGETEALTGQIAILEQQQVEADFERRRLAGELAASGEQYRLTKTELDYLVAKHADEIAEFETQKALLVENLGAFELLKGKYGELEAAYNRLVRPARTMVGRYVVRVRYWREGERIYYSLQEPEQPTPVELSIDELHQRLGELKADHPDNLYTHVIFPGGKEISQEEAYVFERTILSKFDYYESN